jgi:dCMP deaminase
MEHKIRISPMSDIKIKTKSYKNDYGIFHRPIMEYIFMQMAVSLSERSTCLRKKVGVVFTDKEMQRAYCFGYNGDEIGGKNQCESLEPGKCNCIHAEINALTKNNYDITGCTCFITLTPCPVCAKVLINRRVKRVIYLETYRNTHGINLLVKNGIEVIKYDEIIDSNSDNL